MTADSGDTPDGPPSDRAALAWLLAATFLVAVAGLVYELIAATASSYLLGDSVRQFSFVLGVFLSSMGVGAWVSRFVGNTLPGFVQTQMRGALLLRRRLDHARHSWWHACWWCSTRCRVRCG